MLMSNLAVDWRTLIKADDRSFFFINPMPSLHHMTGIRSNQPVFGSSLPINEDALE
jgi:hypothetical protein